MLNAQETFDVVAKHLLTQDRRSMTGGESCQYHSDSGLKCAIGILIPDEVYQKSMEENDVHSLRKAFPGLFGTVLNNDLFDLYQKLQAIHDDATVDSWRENLEELAKEQKFIWKF